MLAEQPSLQRGSNGDLEGGDKLTASDSSGFDSEIDRASTQDVLAIQAIRREDRRRLEIECQVPDVSPWGIVIAIDFYLVQLCCFVGMGATLALIDNLPQLLASLSPDGSVPLGLAANLVSTFSVTNTLGRILAGYLSEITLHKKARHKLMTA